MEKLHDTATECHLPYGITQCYLLPDTSEHTPPDRLVRYSIYRPFNDGGLSKQAQAQGAKSNWLMVATRPPAASETRPHDLTIASRAR